ncbi:hypothetical protein POPTR_010G080633v4 [Populus trichocarpa]|uniref:Uncharacterized protein n=1 Tax=Populus trichocarpa TaxID=3694 RepID=A0ACC0SB75_POPTR|nr:hypothetical protein POPTR_010G080633v4 [Populus trichocarpa]
MNIPDITYSNPLRNVRVSDHRRHVFHEKTLS